MPYGCTDAATFPPLQIPARAIGPRARLRQRGIDCCARARDRLLRDIRLARRDVSRAIRSRHVSRTRAGWGWDLGH